MGKRVSLSLCMIVKDEEQTIERCLNSVKSFISEIIIVDTGSKDKTKDIISKFNAKIYDFEWINDFSAARNYAFSKATSDYIMWLDGDDFINDEDINKIENLLNNIDYTYDYISAEYILARNVLNEVSVSFRRNRIVKREKGFKWIGNVHEYLEVYGNGLAGDFAIEHGKVKPYTDRNLQIFKDMKRRKVKFTPRDMYYYGNELMDNAYYKEAINMYRKFISTKQGWLEDVKGAYLKIIKCFRILGEKDKIINIALESFKEASPHPEILCNLANSFFEEGNFNQAAFWYRAALDSKPERGNMAIINNAYYTWIPSIQLCVCYYKTGQLKCSYFFNELTASFVGDTEKVLYNRKIFKEDFERLRIEVPKLEYPLKLSDYRNYL